MSTVLAGAHIRVYIGELLLDEATSVSYNIDYGETEIYGIDSLYPQEIAATKMTTNGSITSLIIRGSGGLQNKSAIPLINSILQSPYVAIRIEDRQTSEVLFYCPQSKISNFSMTAQSGSTAKLSLNFKGIIPYGPGDIGF